MDELFARPRMPYTIGLLGAVPRVDSADRAPLVPIAGGRHDSSNVVEHQLALTFDIGRSFASWAPIPKIPLVIMNGPMMQPIGMGFS